MRVDCPAGTAVATVVGGVVTLGVGVTGCC